MYTCVPLIKTDMWILIPDWTFDSVLFNQGEGRTIRQYHFTGWPDHGIPETLELVHFLKQVQSCEYYGQGPMLVHCRFVLIV